MSVSPFKQETKGRDGAAVSVRKKKMNEFSTPATAKEDDSKLPSAKIQSMYLPELSSTSYRLLSPLFLEMENEGEHVTIWEERSGAYGSGKNVSEAVEDFQSMLIEMFEQLSESESKLSLALNNQLKYLRSIMGHRQGIAGNV